MWKNKNSRCLKVQFQAFILYMGNRNSDHIEMLYHKLNKIKSSALLDVNKVILYTDF